MRKIALIRMGLVLMAAGAVALAQAQTLTGVTLDKTTVVAGQPVTATVNLSNTDLPNCALRIVWGDRSPDNNFKINNRTQFPKRESHVYQKPGSYTLQVQPRTLGSTFPCTGSDQTATVQVTAAAQAATKPSTGGAGAVACPTGWKLLKRNAKTQEFTCKAAAADTAAVAMSCPGELNFFEDKKKALMGCKK